MATGFVVSHPSLSPHVRTVRGGKHAKDGAPRACCSVAAARRAAPASRFGRPDKSAHELAFDQRRDRRPHRCPPRPENAAHPRSSARASARRRCRRNQRLASLDVYSCSSSAPATQPTHSNMLLRTSSGTSPRTTTSETANRPPGLSTRKASRSTRSLSAERLITQLEITTSTELSGKRNLLDLALEKLDILHARLALVFAGQRQHIVGHVQAVGLAGWPHALGREQHVDAAAGAEIEHRLARLQLNQRRRDCRSPAKPARRLPAARSSRPRRKGWW